MLRHSALVILSSLLALATLATPASAGHGHCYGGWGGGSYGVGYFGGYGYGTGFYGYGYPYRSFYYGNYDPWGIYYRPWDGYSEYYLPPVFAPAELLYGPRAVQQFWGMPQPQQPLVVISRDRDRDATDTRPRVASVEYRLKAERFIAQGDELFREQKYSQALDRYKSAGEMAPNAAEAYWRRGHAYVATGRYDQAVAAFKRALAIDPDVEREEFSLAEFYGPGATAKAAHLEALAGAALARADSSDLHFLLGVFLRYDGQGARAEKFFLRAADLAGRSGDHIAGFLPPDDAAVPVSASEVEI